MNAREIDELSKKSKAEIDANWRLSEKVEAEIKWAAEKGRDYAFFYTGELDKRDIGYLQKQGFYVKHNCDLDRPGYRVFWNSPVWYDRFKRFDYADWILTVLFTLGIAVFAYIIYCLIVS